MSNFNLKLVGKKTEDEFFIKKSYNSNFEYEQKIRRIS